MLVTSNERVSELVESVINFTSKFNTDAEVPLDLIVSQVSTGSKEYIEWGKLQT